MILQIFCACVSAERPAEHREVLAEHIDLPAVDRAPAGDDAVARSSSARAMPKSVQRWATNMSNSSKLPSSSSTSSRSRAVSLPLACCASIRCWPPPSRASARRVSSCLEDVLHAAFPHGLLAGLPDQCRGHAQPCFGGFAKSSCKVLHCNMRSCELWPPRKLYAGVKLREIRARLGLTQAEYAGRSASRSPTSTRWRTTTARSPRASCSRWRSSSASTSPSSPPAPASASSPTCARPSPTRSSARPAAGRPAARRLERPELRPRLPDAAPRLARRPRSSLAQLNEALGRDETALAAAPWEEVRDFFHYCDNYIDPIDRAAEHFAAQLAARSPIPTAAPPSPPGSTPATASRSPPPPTRPSAATTAPPARLTLAAEQPAADPGLPDPAPGRPPRARRAARGDPRPRALPHRGRPRDLQDRPRQLLRRCRPPALRPLPRACPGAAPRPRGARRSPSTPRSSRSASACRRCSGPAPKGIPFFFVRVDQAGTITKRHSATRLQFARFGGACPLWNVHRAFETPGRFLRQLAETPDGVRYLCLARDVSKPGGSFRAPVRRYAIGLGCEIAHAAASSTPTASTSGTTPPTSRSASPAASARAPTATSAPCRRSKAASPSTPTNATSSPTASGSGRRKVANPVKARE